MLTLCACARKADWTDPHLDYDDRVEALLGQMTLSEKLHQMRNLFLEEGKAVSECMEGSSWGTLFAVHSDTALYRRLVADTRQYLRDSARLNIPVIASTEGIQGLLIDGCTIFPHALSQGSTFNPELVRRMASACADEALKLGVSQVLAPVLDIPRDPRWGRIEECYGEDPFLIAEMAVQFVQGYQDKDVACTPKHFVAHGSPVGGLNCSSVSGGERELRSLYLYPFARVIKEASPLSLMSCYSSYDGVPVTGSHYYMTDILRGELGFDGYAYADWGAVHRLENYHHCAKDTPQAALMALKAGIELDPFGAFSSLEQQIQDGEIDEKLIDNAVRHILGVKFRLGLFDQGRIVPPYEQSEIRGAEHLALSKEISDESVILLQNNGILPLDTGRYRRIALLGPNSAQTVFGDYAWPDAGADEGINLLQGLQQRLPAGVTLRQADGCDWWSQDGSGIARAAAIAAQSDIAIVAVGTRSSFLARKGDHNTAGEGNDLSSLELPGRQADLLKAVKATGKPMIVVLISGKPLALPWVKDHADAFLVQWYGGEQQGLSLADVLLGEVNPSGRLNISMPRSSGNIPCYYNYLPGDREYYGGHGGSLDQPAERYVFEKPYALWSFGRGMSYSDFVYESRELGQTQFASGETIRVDVTVRNDSDREGKEVVQLYVRDLVSSVATPVQQLKAFSKITVPAHGRASAHLQVPVEELSLIDADLKRTVESGEFELQIGAASDLIYFRDTITVL